MTEEKLPPAAVSGRRLMGEAEKIWGPLCCWKCYEEKHKDNPEFLLTRPMLLCRQCGNKRCPKATNHELACTGSNEPGQPGSIYG